MVPAAAFIYLLLGSALPSVVPGLCQVCPVVLPSFHRSAAASLTDPELLRFQTRSGDP